MNWFDHARFCLVFRYYLDLATFHVKFVRKWIRCRRKKKRPCLIHPDLIAFSWTKLRWITLKVMFFTSTKALRDKKLDWINLSRLLTAVKHSNVSSGLVMRLTLSTVCIQVTSAQVVTFCIFAARSKAKVN